MTRAEKNPELKKIIDENNLQRFDPVQCIDAFCGTFNFDYTQEEFKQLSGIAQFNIKAHESAIKALIEERIELRQETPEFG